MKHIFTTRPIDEQSIRQKVRRYMAEHHLSGFSLEAIRTAHTNLGIDFATMLIHEMILTDPAESDFQRALNLIDIDHQPSHTTDTALKLLIIPTMYYQEHPELGGDAHVFQLIARRLGIHTQTIPVLSLGSVSQNAHIIADHIVAENEHPIWLIALSKGTSDLKRAVLAHLNTEQRRKIIGIINVAGMPGGTPLVGQQPGKPVSHMMMKQWLRLRGGDRELLDEMHRDHPYARATWTPDKHTHIINIIGLPTLQYVRKPVTKSFMYLSRFGPNDGCVLFEDAIIQPGRLITFWGVDHYMRCPDLPLWAERLLRWIITLRP